VTVAYSREELDWIEAEWAYHLHGRSAFLSREDFQQVRLWEGEGIPAEVVVAAMEVYFTRRAQRAGARTFVALSHLARDVAKGLKLRQALGRSEAPGPVAGAWEAVAEPLRAEPRARAAFEAWQRLKASAPPPDAPGFLDHFDAERAAFRDLVALAEARLGPRRDELREALAARLREAHLEEGTLVWKRAWDHHWARVVCEAWGIQG
jgi:hypothetical protein